MTHAGSQAEVAAILHAQWFYGAHKHEGAPDAILPAPFASPDDPGDDVTDDERQQLLAELTRRSAFSN